MSEKKDTEYNYKNKTKQSVNLIIENLLDRPKFRLAYIENKKKKVLYFNTQWLVDFNMMLLKRKNILGFVREY